MLISSGVSIKIPIVNPQIISLDKNRKVTKLATELNSRTAAQLESKEAMEGGKQKQTVR